MVGHDTSGRRSQEITDSSRWSQWMADALKDLDSSLMLEENQLSHHPYVETLAARKFSGRFSPTGSALRELLMECMSELISESEDEPGLERARQYLILWQQGDGEEGKINVSRIAKALGISREYCSNTVRRTVIRLMVAKFTAKVRARTRGTKK